MKTQTKVQQVKTKKNWYHVSSSKMSAKAEGQSLLDMDTRLPLYRWLFNGHNVLDPLATIVIIISSWWGCCMCRLLSDVIFISLLAVASDTNDKIRTYNVSVARQWLCWWACFGYLETRWTLCQWTWWPCVLSAVSPSSPDCDHKSEWINISHPKAENLRKLWTGVTCQLWEEHLRGRLLSQNTPAFLVCTSLEALEGGAGLTRTAMIEHHCAANTENL